jgi:hypothetical protein
MMELMNEPTIDTIAVLGINGKVWCIVKLE